MISAPPPPIPDTQQHCGYVALVGVANAGKSTLLNALVGEKVSIVTHKVQTTRTAIKGILTQGAHQVIFVDTPGLFKTARPLDQLMAQAVEQVLGEADIIVHIWDASRDLESQATHIRKTMPDNPDQSVKLMCLLNKADLLADKGQLLPMIEQLNALFAYEAIFPVSATTGDGLETFKDSLFKSLPSAPWLYAAEHISDLPTGLLAADILREKILLHVHQEIPYGLVVLPEGVERFKNNDLKINLCVILERASHKPILLGKGGAKIKRVRQLAQQELIEIFDVPVHLFVHVKVDEKWQNQYQILKSAGLISQ